MRLMDEQTDGQTDGQNSRRWIASAFHTARNNTRAEVTAN